MDINNREADNKEVTLTIDGQSVTVPKETNLIKAANRIGIEIPFFCYHHKLSVIGACRMCLVEIENAPKLVTACSTEAREGMVVYTNTRRVKKAQQGMLEFLLINHPLDCPMCDKGGECPLQNLTYRFGLVRSRFIEEKWHFKKPIPIGDRILLDRERCIMCMRCTRFCDEIADHHQIGIINSGRRIEIGVLPGKRFDSNFSGNTIEICPVGALTSISYRFKARPWEFSRRATICTICAVGCNIYIDEKKNEIVRLVSRENQDVDDGWLCDRGRFGFDYVNSDNRLYQPLIRKDGILKPSQWSEAIHLIATRLNMIKERYGANSIGAIASPLCTNEEGYLFKRFFKTIIGTDNIDFWGSERIIQQEIILKKVKGLKRFSYRDIDNASLISIIGCDISKEQPVLDLRIKKAIRKNRVVLIVAHSRNVELARYASLQLIYRYGGNYSLIRAISQAYKNGDLSEDIKGELIEIGLSPEDIISASNMIRDTDNRVILIGDLKGIDQGLEEPLLSILNHLCLQRSDQSRWTSFGRLLRYANSQGMLDMGVGGDGLNIKEMLDPGEEEDGLKGLYIIGPPQTGYDYDVMLKSRWEGLEFLVVCDSYKNNLTNMADVVLPNLTFAERDGTMTNTGSRVQVLRKGIRPSGEARTDWEILVLLSDRVGGEMRYTSIHEIMEEIEKVVPLYHGIKYERLGGKGIERG